MRLNTTTILIAGALLVGPAVQAHEPTDIKACAEKSNDAERLFCFDQAVAVTQATATTSSESSSSGTITAVPPPPIKRIDPNEERKKYDPPPPPEKKAFTANVVAVRKTPRGELVVTLDNDQVWTEKNRAPIFRLQPGDSVTITPSNFGAYRMKGPAGTSTKVTRVE